jgi:hypothetical protein
LSAEHVLHIEPAAQQRTALQAQAKFDLLSQLESRYFLLRFALITVILYSFGFWGVFSTPFVTAAYFGLAICTLTSFISFFVTEWAFDQPKMIFMGVAMASIIVRTFNLLLAFTVGLVFVKLHPAGLISGMFVGYFTYLTIEILYIHNKGLLRGH